MKLITTQSTVLLKHHLKALRMPTMRNECEKVAALAATEVLNLPLSNQLQQRDVVRVCDTLVRAVDELSALPSTQKAAA